MFNWFMYQTSGRTIDDYMEEEEHKHVDKMFQKYGFKPIDA